MYISFNIKYNIVYYIIYIYIALIEHAVLYPRLNRDYDHFKKI